MSFTSLLLTAFLVFIAVSIFLRTSTQNFYGSQTPLASCRKPSPVHNGIPSSYTQRERQQSPEIALAPNSHKMASSYGCFDLFRNPFDSPCGILVHAVVPQRGVQAARLDAFFSSLLDEVMRWKGLSFVAHLPVVIVTNTPSILQRILRVRSGTTSTSHVRVMSMENRSGSGTNYFSTALMSPFSKTLLVNSSVQLPLFDFATIPPTTLFSLLDWYSMLLVPLSPSELCVAAAGFRLFHPALMFFRRDEVSRKLLETAKSSEATSQFVLNHDDGSTDPVEEFRSLVHALGSAVTSGVGVVEVDSTFCVDRHRFPYDSCSTVRNVPPKLKRAPLDSLLTRCDMFRL